jgi:Arc/MetJ-type ribon-helix-helix transcriptional regulator
MVRTQIQLTEQQATRLKRLAAERQRSMADLIREGVDRLLDDEATGISRRERMQSAAASFGRFHSGVGDLAARHDVHFADAAHRR